MAVRYFGLKSEEKLPKNAPVSCSQCPKNGKFTCFKQGFSHDLEDFYHNKHHIGSEDALTALYSLSEGQKLERWSKTLGKKLTIRTPYMDWLLKNSICPLGLISRQSVYWFETISTFDGEMGLSSPGAYAEIPYIFFQALGIVRSERGEMRKEDERGRQKNSNSHQGRGVGKG